MTRPTTRQPTLDDHRRAQGDATLAVLILLTMSLLAALLTIHLIDVTGPLPVALSSTAVVLTVLVWWRLRRAGRRLTAILREEAPRG